MKSASCRDSSDDRLPLRFDGSWRMQRDLAPLGCAVGQRQDVADLGQLQRRAADARLADQLRGIEQAVEVEAASRLEKAAKLARQLVLPLDPGAILRRRERRNASAAQRRRGIDRQQFAQVVEFEHAFAGVRMGLGFTHGKTQLYRTVAAAGPQRYVPPYAYSPVDSPAGRLAYRLHRDQLACDYTVSISPRSVHEELMTTSLSDAFVFFGATGDLAHKKIFPSLQSMIKDGALDVPVIGVAKSGWTLRAAAGARPRRHHQVRRRRGRSGLPEALRAAGVH